MLTPKEVLTFLISLLEVERTVLPAWFTGFSGYVLLFRLLMKPGRGNVVRYGHGARGDFCFRAAAW